MTIPSTVSQGYMSIASYVTNASGLTINNNSGVTLKVVLNGRLKNETSFLFVSQSSIRVVAVCDALFVWVYIRTFDL